MRIMVRVGGLALVASLMLSPVFVAVAQARQAAEEGAGAQVAAEGHGAAASAQETSRKKWGFVAAALCIAVAAFGGALGQGRAAVAALEGIARNPGAADKMFAPMILGLALIESLVIYALVISIIIVFNFGG